MNRPGLRGPDADLATVAARTVAEATAVPPDDLPDDPRAYLAWLRDPARPVRRPKSPRLHVVPEPATGYAPHETRDPAYAAAERKLRRLPDLGIASMQAARAEHGDLPYEDLVIHAANHPVNPPRADTGGHPRTTTDTPTCDCGTALDPDDTCWTCTTSPESEHA
jgi:hypothetical protein